MAKKKLDILQKLSTVTAAMGNIIDSLTGNSTTDAPSIRAVNEAISDINTEITQVKDQMPVVENDLKSENPTQNAPSIQAVLDNLQPKQLLINPDFQVWQRGESISFNDIDTTTSGFKYFADMWCIYFTTGKGDSYALEKVSNGVKCIVSRLISINQFILDALDENKDYTFVVSINNIIHTLTFKGQETKNSNDNVLKHMNKEDTGSYNRLIINIKNNDIINYANLWEADIDYPHVKNKYEYDLEECKKYILNLNDGESYTISIKTKGSNAKFVVWNRFKTAPNFIDNGIEYFNSNSTWALGTISALAYHRNYVDVNINTLNANDGGVLIRNLPILSCEPL